MKSAISRSGRGGCHVRVHTRMSSGLLDGCTDWWWAEEAIEVRHQFLFDVLFQSSCGGGYQVLVATHVYGRMYHCSYPTESPRRRPTHDPSLRPACEVEHGLQLRNVRRSTTSLIMLRYSYSTNCLLIYSGVLFVNDASE